MAGGQKVLNKYQVLIPDWLEDYIKYLAARYDLTFSEIIRAEVCYAILSHVTHFYPDFKPEISPNDILEWLRPLPEKEPRQKEMHRVFSKIYFETRKAIEHRLSKERKAREK
jgi:hypothetical protein